MNYIVWSNKQNNQTKRKVLTDHAYSIVFSWTLTNIHLYLMFCEFLRTKWSISKLLETWGILTSIFEYQNSFDQKYDHFSLLCKQMDIYLRKVCIVRKATSALTFLA